MKSFLFFYGTYMFFIYAGSKKRDLAEAPPNPSKALSHNRFSLI